MKVYKIVRKENDHYISGYSDTATLRYYINKPTKPDFGKLFAFNTLEKAKDYFLYNCALCIFEAEVEGVCNPPRFIGFRRTRVNFLKNLWNQDFNPRDFFELQNPPPGTICCDSLTLLKQVL